MNTTSKIIRWLWPTFVLLLYCTSQVTRSSENAPQNSSNVSLIYQRLRFDDDFLQVYRRFQKHLKLDEKEVIIESNNSQGTRRNPIKFYVNDQVEASSITLDDLIFEALDRSYLTRLMPALISNYDNRDDMLKSSDPKLVSAERCHRELDFLLEQLDRIQQSRVDQRAQISLSDKISPELLVFFDAFATEENGLLMGNYHWPGIWRQCQARRILSLDRSNTSNTLEFRGRYCLASIRSRKWDTKIDQRISELDKTKHFKYDRQRYDYKRFFRIQLGICLPESCDSRLIETRSEDVRRLSVFKLSEPLRSYQLADLFCLPDDSSELRQLEPSAWAFIYFIVSWCLLTVACTLYDSMLMTNEKPQSSLERLVNCMSLNKNIERLLETATCQPPSPLPSQVVQNPTRIDESNSDQVNERALLPGSSSKSSAGQPARRLHPNDMLFLNSIKVVTMPMIIFGHVGMLFKHLDRYVLDYNGLRSDFVFHFQASTPFFVDWYFVITGFLTTYLMFVSNRVARNSPTIWIYSIFHRYWRLAPLYILLFWFSKSIFMHTSSGPGWDYGTSNMTLRAICRRESWLWPLTLTSNLHPIHEECIMPAWYIACDMQFYLITPLLLVLLHKSPLMGWLASIGAIGACISLRLHRYLTDERVQPLELMRPRYDLYMRNNWDMHPTYVYPQYRISTYLIGILAGHYTYMVLSGNWSSILLVNDSTASQTTTAVSSLDSPSARRNNNRTPVKGRTNSRLTRCLGAFTWLFGLQIIVTMMFAVGLISSLFPVEWEKDVKYFTALVYSFDHATTGLGMAYVLVTFMLGHFARLKRFMSKPIWTVLSRVNFIVYLSQVEWIYWLIQSDGQTIEISTLGLVKIFLYLCTFVYLFATVCTVLFELPLAQLEKTFIGVYFNPKRVVSGNHQLR